MPYEYNKGTYYNTVSLLIHTKIANIDPLLPEVKATPLKVDRGDIGKYMSA